MNTTPNTARALAEAHGWAYVRDSDKVRALCGDRNGIVHAPTVFGDANENDTVFGSWEACCEECGYSA